MQELICLCQVFIGKSPISIFREKFFIQFLIYCTSIKSIDFHPNALINAFLDAVNIASLNAKCPF